MYKVIKHFVDLHDADYSYEVGDTFPRKGVKVSERRIAELASDANRLGVPLIKLVEKKPVKKVEEIKAEAKKPKGKKAAAE